MLALAACGCVGPGRGTQDGDFGLSPVQEIELGRAMAPMVQARSGPVLEDFAVHAYVRTIGERVARSTLSPHLPYRFVVVDSAEPAAHSLPGGTVFISTGLLRILQTEAQLAGLIGHQLAHVTAHHGTRELCRRLGASALLEAVRAAARPASAAQRADAAVEAAAEALIAIEYSPADEDAAGRLGLDYAVAAGYNPHQFINLQEILATKLPPDSQFARSHKPADETADRIRTIIDAKYAGRDGRVGEDEYRREVLQRLAAVRG